MKPLPDDRDLSAASRILQGWILGEALSESLKARRNIAWQGNLRRRSKLTLHEAVEAFLAALEIAETAFNLE